MIDAGPVYIQLLQTDTKGNGIVYDWIAFSYLVLEPICKQILDINTGFHEEASRISVWITFLVG